MPAVLHPLIQHAFSASQSLAGVLDNRLWPVSPDCLSTAAVLPRPDCQSEGLFISRMKTSFSCGSAHSHPRQGREGYLINGTQLTTARRPVSFCKHQLRDYRNKSRIFDGNPANMSGSRPFGCPAKPSHPPTRLTPTSTSMNP